MYVELSHVPNVDIIPRGYWGDIPQENNLQREVKSLQEASQVCRDWIEELELGGGNWTGGKVFDNGKQIAEISYNGRIWDKV